MTGERTCDHCGDDLDAAKRADARYCDDDCRHAARDKQRWQANRRDCGHCGTSFLPMRRDARYCSGRCRVAAHRERASSASPDAVGGLVSAGLIRTADDLEAAVKALQARAAQ